MRISDWSSDVCSSDLDGAHQQDIAGNASSTADRIAPAPSRRAGPGSAGARLRLRPVLSASGGARDIVTTPSPTDGWSDFLALFDACPLPQVKVGPDDAILRANAALTELLGIRPERPIGGRLVVPASGERSEEGGVGKGGVSRGRTRWG